MTTTFQTPLQSGDYTKLRGTGTQGNNSYWARQYITLCKNTVIFAARVNGAISSSSFAAIGFDGVTIGAYTDIEFNETLFLSHVNDIRSAYYRGRTNSIQAADSSHIYVNETSVNIADDDYIFVVYDFDGWDKLSRMNGNTQLQDFYGTYHPLSPIMSGLQNAYANWNPDDSAYRVVFNVTGQATDENSSNVLSYQFTFKAGTYSVVSGALNTAVVTVDFTANTENWGKLVITDSQGTTLTRRFYIRAHGSSDVPSLDFSGVQITGSLDSGWNATVEAWNGVSNVLDQTFTVVWNQEYYNGVPGPVSIANNIDMVGRFHREDNSGKGDALYGYVATVKFDIEGVATQMQRLQEQDLTTINKSVAAVWDEISFDTPQRSIVYYLAEHSTFLSLCDLTFPDGFDLTYLFQYFPNQGGNVLDAIKGIANQINANIEFAPDGRIQVVIDTRYKVDKSGVVVVGDFDNRDFTSIGLPVDPVNKTGRLDAYGAANVGGSISAFRSRAPGSAQGYAAGQSTLDAQIVPAGLTTAQAQAIVNYNAGQKMAIDNLTYSQDWQDPSGGYHFLIPSRGQRVTHTLTTATNVRGLSFDTSDYWQVVSITINHDNATGKRTVSTHEELEPPVGDSGDTVPQIAGGTQTNPILLQPLDPFPALPDDPGNYLSDDPTPNPYPPLIPPKTGETTIYCSATLADTSRSVVSRRAPVWTGATPTLGSYTIRDVTFDRTSINPPIGAYIVASDGTNSIILYTSDAFAKPVVWTTTGTPFAGVYTQIRSAGTSGSVLVYTSADDLTTTVFDFTINDQGWTAPTSGGLPTANYVALTGWSYADFNSGGDTRAALIQYSYVSTQSIIGIRYYFNRTNGTVSTPGDYDEIYADNSGGGGPATIQYQPTVTNPPEGNHVVFSWSGAVASANYLFLGPSSSFGDHTGSVLIYRVEVDTGSGDAQVRYSSDFGATVGSAITVGTGPGKQGAFDLEKVGNVSLASAAGQVKIATTLGGSYSNATGGTLSAGNPVTIAIPIRRWPHGATQYTASDPDYLLAGDTLISSASVWKVDGSSGTKTDITPVAGALGVGPNLATMYQTGSACHIAIVVNVAGAFKLYVSANAGVSWVLSKTCINPIYLRYKRNSPAVLYLLDGANFYVSLNHGSTWLTDTLPSSDVAVALDSYN